MAPSLLCRTTVYNWNNITMYATLSQLADRLFNPSFKAVVLTKCGVLHELRSSCYKQSCQNVVPSIYSTLQYVTVRYEVANSEQCCVYNCVCEPRHAYGNQLSSGLWRRKKNQLPKRRNFIFLYLIWMMDKVQKTISSQCYIPSSERFTIYMPMGVFKMRKFCSRKQRRLFSLSV
jgi:hypothetical protein